MALESELDVMIRWKQLEIWQGDQDQIQPDTRCQYKILPGAARKLDQDVPLYIVENLAIENE